MAFAVLVSNATHWAHPTMGTMDMSQEEEVNVDVGR
jgi:hypothetical protein